MAAPGTLYDVLGCAPGASSAELRRAYLARLPSAHPDRGGSAEAFGSVQQAWTVLGDAQERAAYDDRLSRAEHGQPQAGHRLQVVHHGQTVAQHHPQPHRPPERASARARSATEAALDEAVREACRVLEACRDSPVDRAAAGQELCRAHAARGAHAEAAGRLHHALFDAREAVRLADAVGGDGLQAMVSRLQEAVDAQDDVGEDGSDEGSLDGTWA